MFGYFAFASCACGCHAAPSKTNSAKILNAIVLTVFRFIGLPPGVAGVGQICTPVRSSHAWAENIKWGLIIVSVVSKVPLLRHHETHLLISFLTSYLPSA